MDRRLANGCERPLCPALSASAFHTSHVRTLNIDHTTTPRRCLRFTSISFACEMRSRRQLPFALHISTPMVCTSKTIHFVFSYFLSNLCNYYCYCCCYDGASCVSQRTSAEKASNYWQDEALRLSLALSKLQKDTYTNERIYILYARIALLHIVRKQLSLSLRLHDDS